MRELNLPPGLIEAVAERLSAHPSGISEYDMIGELDRHYPELFPKPDLRDPLLLFQHHFVLMHVLYRLQDDGWRQRRTLLEIGPLRIRMRPAGDGDGCQLSIDRSLRDYYLDWNNLGRENTDSVQQLLEGFWKRLLGEERRPEALADLGLKANADATAIKARYRELASEHHPDKGGDPDEFRRIRVAYERLMASRKR